MNPTGNWPTGGIEELGCCPVCRSSNREILHEGLTDRIFFTAPGSWTMQMCRNCGCGYLDPRPTVGTIHLAYSNYHTHTRPPVQRASTLRGARWLQRALANGYKNWRFGLKLHPSSRLGIVAAFLLPIQRAILDRQFRHLPRNVSGGRVLDIGCGDGSFLENARAMGWLPIGTDLDPEVVQNATKQALDVRLGTVEGIEGPFDVITMGHVIEHLHDPIAVLRTCYRLLAPGGWLWLETPNVDALGRRRFGVHWRGFEPPRHLVLFSRRSLKQALRSVGFTAVRDLRQPSPVYGMYGMSSLIESGLDPNSLSKISFSLKLEMLFVKLREWLIKSDREFLALVATKPARPASEEALVE